MNFDAKVAYCMAMMRLAARATLLAASVLLVAPSAGAQLAAAKDGPIVYGHHHLTVTDLAAHRKFWVDTLGGTPGKLGNIETIAFTNVIVMLRQGTPSGGSKGTPVNHVGFAVPNLKAMVDKLRAAGYTMATRAELPPSQEVKDDIAFSAGTKNNIAFVMAPDDVKVEFSELPAMPPLSLHHIHFNTTDVDGMKAWYTKTFNAKPGMRGTFQAADLPGVNLTFSPTTDALVTTRGRSLDHIGFEVKNLEAFCKQLESAGVKFDRPYAKVPALGIAVAFLTDPYGTYIELTEGLAK